MRELSKSMIGFSWAMSLFGLKQLAHIVPTAANADGQSATEAFNAVSRTAQAQLGDAMSRTFSAGDNLQRGMIDMMFGLLSLGSSTSGPCANPSPRKPDPGTPPDPQAYEWTPVTPPGRTGQPR